MVIRLEQCWHAGHRLFPGRLILEEPVILGQLSPKNRILVGFRRCRCPPVDPGFAPPAVSGRRAEGRIAFDVSPAREHSLSELDELSRWGS